MSLVWPGNHRGVLLFYLFGVGVLFTPGVSSVSTCAKTFVFFPEEFSMHRRNLLFSMCCCNLREPFVGQAIALRVVLRGVERRLLPTCVNIEKVAALCFRPTICAIITSCVGACLSELLEPRWRLLKACWRLLTIGNSNLGVANLGADLGLPIMGLPLLGAPALQRTFPGMGDGKPGDFISRGGMLWGFCWSLPWDRFVLGGCNPRRQAG